MDLNKIGDYTKAVKDKIKKGQSVVINKQSFDFTDFTNTDRADATTLVNKAYKTIDTLALTARAKADSIVAQLLSLSSTELCDSNVRNEIILKRLMNININEKDITLSTLGIDAAFNGDSRNITSATLNPSYVEEINYKENFVKKLSTTDGGTGVTQTSAMGNPYEKVYNHYPDENGKGQDFEKWNATDTNSILYKTKELFKQNKINTLISRFHTDPTTPINENDVRTEKYGLSHGRNLLTKIAEDGGSYEPTNGYDNPYCRVWTHHHQYDRLDKLIRPFVTKVKGNSTVTKLTDFHHWEQFEMKDTNFENGDNESKNNWGWKHNTNDAWSKSVLQDNGFVNITPKFVNGGSTNIHTKQCMFSIENLAWRDYDPYSFEKALSWEQRGPMGGRIMWFPPYGISFNETTTTNWQSNTFIGRGEDVYSYVNTKRSGTLNFMLVVDHPSINDYVSFYEKNQETVSDTDLLRFQAGCDELNGSDNTIEENSLKNSNTQTQFDYDAAKKKETSNGFYKSAHPTPLTDEYIEKADEGITVEEKEKKVDENKVPDSVEEVTFFVFYPNNYSGYYDTLEDSVVEPIAYLLYGQGSQMKANGSLTTSLNLDFEDVSNSGCGYEMKKDDNSGISLTNLKNSKNYIIGTDNWRWNNTGEYIPNYNKKWYYRIDGLYKNIDNPSNSNCYNQTLSSAKSYSDNKSIGLNSNVNSIDPSLKNGIDEKYFCSLAEFAAAISTNNEIIELIKRNSSGYREDKVNELKTEILSNEKGRKLTNITVYGYSNSHGYNADETINDLRNKFLAEQRGKTIIKWLRKYWKNDENGWLDKLSEDIKVNVIPSVDVEQTDKKNESGDRAKLYRSAKVVLQFSSSEQKTVTESNPQANIADINVESILKELNEKLNKYLFYSKEEAESKKDETIKNFLHNILNTNYPNADGLDKVEEILNENNLINAIDTNIEHVNFEKPNNDDLEKTILSNCNESSSAIFESNDDFNNKIGYQIIEGIKKQKDIVEEINKYSTEVKNYNNLITNNEKYISNIETINNNIKSLEQKNSEIENEIKTKEEIIEDNKNIISNWKDELVKVENNKDINEQDKKHEINKINNKIKEIEEQNVNVTNEIESLKKEINKNNDTIKKEEENRRKLYSETKEIDENFLKKIDLFGKINFNSVVNIIKNYIEQKTNIDKYCSEAISNDIASIIIDKDNIEANIDYINNDIDVNVFYKSDELWKELNETIMMYAEKDQDNVNYTITLNGLKNVFNELNCCFFSSDFILNINDIIVYEPETGFYNINFKNEDLNNLIEKINKLTKINPNFKEFYVVLDNILQNNFYLYESNLNANSDKIIEDITNKLKDYKEAIDSSQYVGFSKHKDSEGNIYYINENPPKDNRQWIYDENEKKMKLKNFDGVENRSQYDDFKNKDGSKDGANRWNKLRYDQEYHFFKILQQSDPVVFDKLMKKIQYFNPAYHSMTPEGFSARLTFLQQCTRQGDTTTATDRNAKSANNLAFGRPPFCILRLGDFYNQMIVIENISISYDPLVWDLNTEGAGVIPLIANVSISFNFIGGGSMYGAVNRLQNAMSFNYYANTNLYDNRSDRPVYNWDNKTGGALNHDLDHNSSYFHTVQTYKNKN